jgi:hypothetical protein
MTKRPRRPTPEEFVANLNEAAQTAIAAGKTLRLLAELCMEVDATLSVEQLAQAPELRRLLEEAEAHCVREIRGATSFDEVAERIGRGRREMEEADGEAHRARAGAIQALWDALEVLDWMPTEAAGHLGLTPQVFLHEIFGYGDMPLSELQRWHERLLERVRPSRAVEEWLGRVFGLDRTAARRWLSTPLLDFAGRTPHQLLQSGPEGEVRVIELLATWHQGGFI